MAAPPVPAMFTYWTILGSDRPHGYLFYLYLHSRADGGASFFSGVFVQRLACTYWKDPPSFPVCPCWVECSKDLSRSNQLAIQLAPLLDGGAIISAAVNHFPHVLLFDKFAAAFKS